jgi:hypothetical protein
MLAKKSQTKQGIRKRKTLKPTLFQKMQWCLIVANKMWYKTTTNQPTCAIENNDEEHNEKKQKQKKTRALVPKAKLFQKL